MKVEEMFLYLCDHYEDWPLYGEVADAYRDVGRESIADGLLWLRDNRKCPHYWHRGVMARRGKTWLTSDEIADAGWPNWEGIAPTWRWIRTDNFHHGSGNYRRCQGHILPPRIYDRMPNHRRNVLYAKKTPADYALYYCLAYQDPADAIRDVLMVWSMCEMTAAGLYD